MTRAQMSSWLQENRTNTARKAGGEDATFQVTVGLLGIGGWVIPDTSCAGPAREREQQHYTSGALQ